MKKQSKNLESVRQPTPSSESQTYFSSYTFTSTNGHESETSFELKGHNHHVSGKYVEKENGKTISNHKISSIGDLQPTKTRKETSEVKVM